MPISDAWCRFDLSSSSRWLDDSHCNALSVRGLSMPLYEDGTNRKLPGSALHDIDRDLFAKPYTAARIGRSVKSQRGLVPPVRSMTRVRRRQSYGAAVMNSSGGAPSHIEAEPFPFPGTPAARKYGCLCPVSEPRQGTEESPLVLHTNCPLHGVKAYEEHLKGPRH